MRVFIFIVVALFTLPTFADQTYQEQKAVGIWQLEGSSRLLHVDEHLVMHWCVRLAQPSKGLVCEAGHTLLSYDPRRDAMNRDAPILKHSRLKVDPEHENMAILVSPLRRVNIMTRIVGEAPEVVFLPPNVTVVSDFDLALFFSAE